MEEGWGRIIKSTVLAGLLTGLIAPLIWPVVIMLSKGQWPTWSIYPMAALTISLITIIITIPCSLIIGSPALFYLEKVNLNVPTVVGVLGLIVAFFMYLLVAEINNFPLITQAWPLAVFFSILGAINGVTSSMISRTNILLST